MRILFLDCGMGAAGDMLQGALVSLLTKEEQESFVNRINNIGIHDVSVTLSDDEKCGITGKHVRVDVLGQEEHSHDVHEHDHHHEEDYHHEHDHHHEHHHHHASMADITHMISHMDVSEKVKNDVINIYQLIAQAESKVHGKPVTEVHFHEVGMKDALIDITGVAMLIEELNVDKIVCSPINVGFGKVKCAHGILPVPAPATSEIIQGIPVYAGKFEGEMCTPTGAAILKHFTDEFSKMPLMSIEKSGYGTGNKDFEAANVVKAVIGNSFEGDNYTDSVTELRCNVDDMTGEELAYAIEKILEAGARDAFVSEVFMKKNRAGYLITVLCTLNDKEKIAEAIFKYTSTIGIRECQMERMILNRTQRVVSTEYGDVRIKVSEGYSVKKEKAEFDDLKLIAEKTGMTISEIRELVNKG